MAKGSKLLDKMMAEVHRNVPSTVTRAHVTGMQKEKMMEAIAYSKARKAGAKIRKKK